MLELAGRIVAVLVHRSAGYRYAEDAAQEYWCRRERFEVRGLGIAPPCFSYFFRGIPIQMRQRFAV
ncbi:hypothetical protein WI95_31210 [Burkholderia contaminans]|uniref:Uncharacterized protein n=1 Tax=Burkholderia contaminans TaxID=488447 RepID=A0A0G3Z677_9BURK|nr:hypothetical protein NL30_35945 [Burkholderia contaminans]AOL08537.1 hypothetical protein WI95_31210 [Burkholderia contaminans]RQT18967.1 hypothetical protein DF037_34475 [Burkholderia contaminans]